MSKIKAPGSIGGQESINYNSATIQLQFNCNSTTKIIMINQENGERNMSYADTIFINMCKDILENGTSTEGEKVRPHWPDGASAYTIKKFGVVNR